MLIVLGDWAEAEKLTGLLPVEDSSVRLLRSELAFVRGDFDGALAEAEMALIDNAAERVIEGYSGGCIKVQSHYC